MNCLAEERFVEILDGGGLDATRPDERAHLETCDACRESWATVAAAGEILAQAKPPVARWRLVPVMVAAAMLLAIVGIVVWQSSPPPVERPRDPVVMLLEGTPEEVRTAREALLKQGKRAIPVLVAARPKFKGSARLQALQDLIFDLKRAVQQDPEVLELFNKLATARIDLDFENVTFDDILSFIRSFSGLQIVLDPTIDGRVVDKLNMKNSTMKSVLEVLCSLKDLDFDHRYGVVFLTTPMRLWSTDPAVGLPAKNQWETQILAGADLKIVGHLTNLRISMDMQNAPLSAVNDYLSDICGFKFKPDPAIASQMIDLRVADLRLRQLLQLLTLPRGWDVRIEGGEVRVFPRGR